MKRLKQNLMLVAAVLPLAFFADAGEQSLDMSCIYTLKKLRTIKGI